MAAPQSSADAAVSAKDAIPTAIFIEDIESYMKREGTAEAALEKLQRLYSAFKFMEQRLTQKKAKLKIKLPEIEKTYNSLMQMEAQSKLGEPLTSHYELAQSIFAKAKINVHENDKVRGAAASPLPERRPRAPRALQAARCHFFSRRCPLTPAPLLSRAACAQVCLWLGANVMLEYPRAEAISLLSQQLADAKTALATTVDDMGFLRDQITTTEVNMARVFNWDVKNRRNKKDAEAAEVS